MNKKEESNSYQLVNVPSTFELAVQTPDGNTITEAQALVAVLNKLDELKKLIG